jgi:hypothetical protein
LVDEEQQQEKGNGQQQDFLPALELIKPAFLAESLEIQV